jgi:hypothetical protein
MFFSKLNSRTQFQKQRHDNRPPQKFNSMFTLTRPKLNPKFIKTSWLFMTEERPNPDDYLIMECRKLAEHS